LRCVTQPDAAQAALLDRLGIILPKRLHVLTRGNSFGEVVVFTVDSYPATAEVVSEARVVRIPAGHVVRCIREVPDIAPGIEPQAYLSCLFM
jgi:hypothetical protein